MSVYLRSSTEDRHKKGVHPSLTWSTKEFFVTGSCASQRHLHHIKSCPNVRGTAFESCICFVPYATFSQLHQESPSHVPPASIYFLFNPRKNLVNLLRFLSVISLSLPSRRECFSLEEKRYTQVTTKTIEYAIYKWHKCLAYSAG